MRRKKWLILPLVLSVIMSGIPTHVMAEEYNDEIVPQETAQTEDGYGLPGVDYVEGEVIACIKHDSQTVGIQSDSGFQMESLMDVTASLNADDGISLQGIEEDIPTVERELVLVTGGDTETMIAELEADPYVEYAEPNYILKLNSFGKPTDEDNLGYRYQWGINKEQASANINAEMAWENTEEGAPVVAVVDSGVDYNNTDLKEIMWQDGLNYPTLTNMGGGTYGYNPANIENSADPMDTIIGHGTHCAGIIAAQWNNSEGGAGVSPNARIMALRMFGDNGSGTLLNAIRCLAYVQAAKAAGVNVVATSNSWGPGSYNGVQVQSVSTAVQTLGKQGVLSFFSANNNGSNNDENVGSISAGPYAVIVGAMDSAGYPAVFTCYGKRTVDVFAPGTQILSTASTNTEKTEMNKHAMPLQYLPQIQDLSDSYFYEDFEDGESDISLSLYDKDNNLVKTETAAIGETGYGGGKDAQFDLSKINDGDLFQVQITIPKDKLKDILPDSDVYLALDVNYGGCCIGTYPGIQTYTNGEWKDLDSTTLSSDGNPYPVYISISDYNWNQGSGKVLTPQMLLESKDNNGDCVLRICNTMDYGKNQAKFKLDNFGIGKSPSEYCYSDGTSMATPMAAGVAALLSTRGIEVDEIAARIRGGVNRSTAKTGLAVASVSGGYLDAGKAFTNPVPVLNELNTDGSVASITGYFFGEEQGRVIVNDQEVTVNAWNAGEIKIELPEGMSGSVEVKVIRPESEEEWGRGFFDIVPTTIGYDNCTAPSLSYDAIVEGIPITSADSITSAMAGAGHTILRIAVIVDNDELIAEAYDTQKDEWRKILLPNNGESIRGDDIQLAGGKEKIYMLYTQVTGDDEQVMLATFYPDSDTWRTIRTELCGGEALAMYKNQLLTIGGVNDHNQTITSIKAINPKTGGITESLPDLPESRVKALAYTSGDKLILAGGYSDPETKQVNTMVYDGNKWTVNQDDFFNDNWDNNKFDYVQTLNFAIGATNTGLIVTGPVHNLGEADMVDTWKLNAETGTWEASTDLLYHTRKTVWNKGTSLDGKFYALGFQGGLDHTLIFRSTPIDYTAPIADPEEEDKKNAPSVVVPPSTSTTSTTPTSTVKPNNVNTGDETNVSMYVLLLFAAMGIIGCQTIVKRYKK